jgi:hypothetical protein
MIRMKECILDHSETGDMARITTHRFPAPHTPKNLRR